MDRAIVLTQLGGAPDRQVGQAFQVHLGRVEAEVAEELLGFTGRVGEEVLIAEQAEGRLMALDSFAETKNILGPNSPLLQRLFEGPVEAAHARGDDRTAVAHDDDQPAAGKEKRELVQVHDTGGAGQDHLARFGIRSCQKVQDAIAQIL